MYHAPAESRHISIEFPPKERNSYVQRFFCISLYLFFFLAFLPSLAQTFQGADTEEHSVAMKCSLLVDFIFSYAGILWL